MNMFQVPKGMLQTLLPPLPSLQSSQVSSPQGNATNAATMLMMYGWALSFKSPRECYKRFPVKTCLSAPAMFQVPKGMLQTGNELQVVYDTTACFKSPRECYKPSQPDPVNPKHGVSSPQGNATNNGRGTLEHHRLYPVSSPQGNATNICLGSRTYSRSSPFQVPKGMLQTS